MGLYSTNFFSLIRLRFDRHFFPARLHAYIQGNYLFSQLSKSVTTVSHNLCGPHNQIKPSSCPSHKSCAVNKRLDINALCSDTAQVIICNSHLLMQLRILRETWLCLNWFIGQMEASKYHSTPTNLSQRFSSSPACYRKHPHVIVTKHLLRY